jgi:hypothetical protein
MLTNFTPVIGSTGGSDTGGNTSMQKTVTNGVCTINNITANYLTASLSKRNITFYFKSKTAGSAWARTEGLVPVTIATVTPTPGAIAYNEPAFLEILVTARGTVLPDVLINISIPGLSGEMSARSDAEGKVFMAFTPPTTGDIDIEVENRTSDTKVRVTSWKLYLDTDTQTNEQESFTVTVRNNSATGAVIEGATVLFNRVTQTTDSSGQATFTAPSITANKDIVTTAIKDGYADDSAVVTVVNVPKLVIVPPSGEITTTSSFDITIADDAGSSIVGATVTFNGNTYTSGAQGLVTLTAPETEGTYTITATKAEFKDADAITFDIKAGGIPGFELLTLVAAIGVALILLRRRR